MAVQGPIPVEFGSVFPRGVFAAGGFEPVRDFEASKGGRFVQSKDKVTGLPLWVVEVIDGDPQARDKTARVKVAAPDQPVLPPAHPGMPFVPVEFAGLTVTPVREPGRAAGLLAESDRGPHCGPDRPQRGRWEGRGGVSSDGGSFSCSSLRVGTDWHVRCSTYPDEAPIVSVDAGPMSASISPADRHQVSAEAVAFARELARQAARFAADCERLHAAQADQAHDNGPVAANDAA